MADSSSKSFDLLGETDRAPNPWPVPSSVVKDKSDLVDYPLIHKKSIQKKRCNLEGPTSSEKKTVNPTAQKLTGVGKNSKKNAARDSYYNAYSYGVGRKQPPPLESFEKFPDSPRGLTKRGIAGRSGQNLVTRGKNEKTTEHFPRIPPLMETLLEPLEMLTIETSRKVIHEGGITYEERCTIKFPKHLPPNCHVITHHQK